MEDVISTVNAEPVVNVEPQANEQVQNNEPVNAGSTEVTQPTDNKPVQSPEENAKFAEMRRAREAAETKAAQIEKDYQIAKEFGAEWGVYSEKEISEKYGSQGITNYEQLKEAAWRYKMQQEGVNPDLIKQYVSEDPDVKWAREFRTRQEAEDFKNKNKVEFLTYFKKENDRDFDVTKDTIPDEVWIQSELYEKSKGKEGKPLSDAYAIHYSKQLKAKIAEFETKFKALETNQQNASSTPGSVTGNGSVDTGHISFEAFESNKGDQGWVKKNLTKIMESRAKW